jgi:hypothetical protein
MPGQVPEESVLPEIKAVSCLITDHFQYGPDAFNGFPGLMNGLVRFSQWILIHRHALDNVLKNHPDVLLKWVAGINGESFQQMK